MTAEGAAQVNCDVERRRNELELLRLKGLFDTARFYDDFDMLREYNFEEWRPYPVDCWPEPIEPEVVIDVGGTPR